MCRSILPTATALLYASLLCLFPSPEKYPFRCISPDKAPIHPLYGDSIPIYLLLLSVHLFPVTVCLGVEMGAAQTASSGRRYAFLKRAGAIFADYFAGLIYVSILIEVLKWLVKEHRPHFFYTCKPDWNSVVCVDGLAVEYTCTGEDYIKSRAKAELYKAFPSGHAALTAYMCVFMCFYLHYRLQPNYGLYFLRPWIQLLFLIWAIICSITRVTDNRHWWWDVATGAGIGVVGALYIVFTHSSSHAFPWNRHCNIQAKETTPCEETPLVCRNPTDSDTSHSSRDEDTKKSRAKKSKAIR